MGRPRKTDRHDEFDDVEDQTADRESEREQTSDTFEQPMFADEVSSPFHLPKDLWPDGMAMRWISVEVTGAPDNRNWSIKTAAHWTPVQRGKYPEIDKRFPTVPMPGGGNVSEGLILFGGLCLCERDIRYNIRDRKLQEKATADAARTVESYVEAGTSNFPRFNQSSQVQYERGVRPVQFKE